MRTVPLAVAKARLRSLVDEIGRRGLKALRRTRRLYTLDQLFASGSGR